MAGGACALDWGPGGAETPIAVTATLPNAPAAMAIPVRCSGIKSLVGSATRGGAATLMYVAYADAL